MKYNIEIVKEIFKKENCELLDTEYINKSTKMNYICSCGNPWKTSLSKFKAGQRCKKCRYRKMSEKSKYTYDFVYNYFKDQGCELLSDEIIDVRTNLKYRCVCGNISYCNFDNFKNKGKRCKKCSGTEKLTYDYVKSYIESFNYKLLSDEYINNSTKLKVKCDLDHVYDVTYSSFKRGARCIICFRNKQKELFAKKYKHSNDRNKRTDYLQFDTKNLNILKDEPLYENYIKSQKEAKLSNNIWDKTKYSVDHIYPRVAFINNNLDKIYEPNFIKKICNSRDNLRIVTREQNREKWGSYNQEEFMTWFNEKIKQYNNV